MKIKMENERQQVQDYNDLFTKPNDKEVEDSRKNCNDEIGERH